MDHKTGVTLEKIIQSMKLKVVHMPESAGPDGAQVSITTSDINRPGLPFTGCMEFFDPKRIQIVGKVEHNYLMNLTPEKRSEVLDTLMATKIPALVVSRGLDIPDEMLAGAKKHEIPLLTTELATSAFLAELIKYLNVQLAPCVTRHGVLVEVYGEGILILGESGVGKSETAMELLKRGHRLVADDAVEIKRVSATTLLGSAPDIIRYLMELRGIGIIDVRHLFGMGAVKDRENIDLVIQLEAWDEKKQYDRLGLDEQYYDILGVSRPSIVIPVRPGRNLAIIIEVAAMNHRQKMLGYNAAEEFNKRLMEQMGISAK